MAERHHNAPCWVLQCGAAPQHLVDGRVAPRDACMQACTQAPHCHFARIPARGERSPKPASGHGPGDLPDHQPPARADAPIAPEHRQDHTNTLSRATHHPYSPPGGEGVGGSPKPSLGAAVVHTRTLARTRPHSTQQALSNTRKQKRSPRCAWAPRCSTRCLRAPPQQVASQPGSIGCPQNIQPPNWYDDTSIWSRSYNHDQKRKAVA